MTQLHKLGIRFLVADGSIETDRGTRAGQSLLRVLTVLAKAESNMIARNVRAGIAEAQRKGIHCCRPRGRFPLARARKLREEGLSIRAIATHLSIPASTVADALKAESRRGGIDADSNWKSLQDLPVGSPDEIRKSDAVAGSAGSPQCNAARLVELLLPRRSLPGVSGRSWNLPQRQTSSLCREPSRLAKYSGRCGPARTTSRSSPALRSGGRATFAR